MKARTRTPKLVTIPLLWGPHDGLEMHYVSRDIPTEIHAATEHAGCRALYKLALRRSGWRYVFQGYKPNGEGADD